MASTSLSLPVCLDEEQAGTLHQTRGWRADCGSCRSSCRIRQRRRSSPEMSAGGGRRSRAPPTHIRGNSRCCGSMIAASLGLKPKNDASNRSRSCQYRRPISHTRAEQALPGIRRLPGVPRRKRAGWLRLRFSGFAKTHRGCAQPGKRPAMPTMAIDELGGMVMVSATAWRQAAARRASLSGERIPDHRDAQRVR